MMSDPLPVDNLIIMEVLKTEYDTSCVEDSPGLSEDISMNVHHQITTCSVLHHETHVALEKNGYRIFLVIMTG